MHAKIITKTDTTVQTRVCMSYKEAREPAKCSQVSFQLPLCATSGRWKHLKKLSKKLEYTEKEREREGERDT